MQLRRPVICAVDTSADALQAARSAARFAEQTRAPLLLVHAVAHGADADAHGHGAAVLRDLTHDLDAEVRPRTMLVVGDPAGAVLEAARTTDAAALFLGARGSGRSHRFLLGATAAAVTAHAPCPVVLTPDASADVVDLAGGTIVHGIVDGATNGTAHVADLARRLASELVLVHVYGPRTVVDPYDPDARARCDTAASARRLLELIAAGIDVPARLVTERATGTMAGVLTRIADEVDAACVSVSARPQGPLTSALTGSATTGLAASGRPVLVVPSGAAARALDEPPRAAAAQVAQA